MLKQVEVAKQRWGGANKTIDGWLLGRKQLLIQYCELAGVNYQRRDALPDASEVSEFCTLLMDYLSAGHFEVYEMLVSDNADGLALKQRIYPLIAATTDLALDFNDSYADDFHPDLAAKFEKSVAALGEALVERFELEDELIQHMHGLVQTPVTE
ncbi:sigma D regulator [Aestuariibacter sp. GS-14]|uniref:sigma D regulator n=1 Tax=Aestuariibacter sp. GS-14 TaxID=2590670 RepID=UPI00112D8AD8|nr:sigma D regulator [Aestuariibacter sp. GS-14]TPV54554.1 sigma D regulator [Aestuariibacter sp. GS-14]